MCLFIETAIKTEVDVIVEKKVELTKRQTVIHEKLHVSVKKFVCVVKDQSRKDESDRLVMQSVIHYVTDRKVNEKAKRE